MVVTQKEVNAVIMRGGTSRGVFLKEVDVPNKEREEFLVKLIGSPDPLEVDGLGGGFSSTSKAILVKKNNKTREIDYIFAQVYVEKPKVDYNGNCGNLTSAVGPYAVEERMVSVEKSSEPKSVELPLFNVNTQKHIRSRFNIVNGRPDYVKVNNVTGVPKSGVSVYYEILDPVGTVPNVDPVIEPSLSINFEGQKIEVSVMDITSVYAFVEPHVLGLTGVELPPDVNSNSRLLERAEKLRKTIKKELGDRLPSDPESDDSQSALRLIMVSKMRNYKDWLGNEVHKEDADIMIRAFSMGKMHHSVPFTAAMCTAATLKIPESIPAKSVGIIEGQEVRIAHPKGVAKSYADVKEVRGRTTVISVGGYRTARLLMKGKAFVQV